jgi:hypothetical protein
MIAKPLTWQKLGQVFEPDTSTNPAWMIEYAQAPNGILLMDKLRVFFCSRTAPDSAGQYVSRVGYVDLDPDNPRNVLGISEEPVLDLGLPGSFDEHGTYPFSAVVTGDTVTAIYGGWSRCSSVPFDVSLGLAKAKLSDLKFEKVGKGPVLTKSLHEPFVVSSPRLGSSITSSIYSTLPVQLGT